jgi:DNA-binding ferritin-like protein
MAGLAGSNVKVGAKEDLAKMIGTMMSARTFAHLAHLKTPSFAAHKALDGFYTDIVELMDSFAEASQGLHGKLDIPFVNLLGNVKDPISGLDAYLKQLDSLSKGCENKALENIYQEVQSLFYKTQYLLAELS